MNTEVKFGDWLRQGYDLYKANWQILLVVNLIAMAIGIVTAGILSGPMSAGVALVTLALLDKKSPAPEVGDVFKGFDYFLPSFLFVLVFGYGLAAVSMVLSFIPCLGSILSIFFSLAVATAVMFGLLLIVDKKMDFWPAAQASYSMVKSNFWPYFGLLVVASLIAQAGMLLCFVGIVITAPLYFTILAVAYRAFDGPAEPANELPSPAETAQPTEETPSPAEG